MIKIWGRKTSSNVQKAMWAIGEIGLPHERIDIGGAFGKNREAEYLAMNPNGLVPTLRGRRRLSALGVELDRALSRRQAQSGGAGAGRSANAGAGQQMDGLATLGGGPAITPVFWGLIRTPPEKRDHAAIEDGKKKTTAAMTDGGRAAGQNRLSRRRCVLLWRHSGRHHGLPLSSARPERPALQNFERWYAAIQAVRRSRIKSRPCR